MAPVKLCLHVLYMCHPLNFFAPAAFANPPPLAMKKAASSARHSTCASPASPRHAHPDWIGGGSSLRQMMHAPASDPPPVALPCTAIRAAALQPAVECRVTSAFIHVHSCLWPPCFQCTLWHAAEQYVALMHREQRCNPGLLHSVLTQFGLSPALDLPLPDILGRAHVSLRVFLDHGQGKVGQSVCASILCGGRLMSLRPGTPRSRHHG
jgi:hypothetical protein